MMTDWNEIARVLLEDLEEPHQLWPFHDDLALAACERLVSWDRSDGDIALLSEACSMARLAIAELRPQQSRG